MAKWTSKDLLLLGKWVIGKSLTLPEAARMQWLKVTRKKDVDAYRDAKKKIEDLK